MNPIKKFWRFLFPQDHVVIEKKFVFKVTRESPKDRVSTKEKKRVQKMVASEYDKWRAAYDRKWGVIGPDGYPTATIPAPHDNGHSIIVGMKVGYIVSRQRQRWERLVAGLNIKTVVSVVANAIPDKGGQDEGGEAEAD